LFLNINAQILNYASLLANLIRFQTLSKQELGIWKSDRLYQWISCFRGSAR